MTLRMPTTPCATSHVTPEPADDAVCPTSSPPILQSRLRVEVSVHDASRLAWLMTVPLPDRGRAAYSFELEVEAPANVVGAMDPWAALQSYARLDAATDTERPVPPSIEAFRHAVVAVSSRLARAREGFVRHCTAVRASALPEENQVRPLLLWIDAARAEMAGARAKLLSAARSDMDEERTLADEFLSGRLWTVITDSARALLEAKRAIEERSHAEAAALDEVEEALAAALRDELSYRRGAAAWSLASIAEPANAQQLERLLSRMRWLKRHFERVLFLDVESYQVASRLAGWFSAFTAMVAYLWFLFWQFALERHPGAIGSGVVAFALLTAAAYASRERLKEIVRNWLAGRVQSMFAQRVTRCRLPAHAKDRRFKGQGGDSVVASARESFSQSSAQRPDPVHPDCDATHEVTLLRFAHRGRIATPAGADGRAAPEVRLIYRLDLSALFPRLHDAVRGLASLDAWTGGITLVDVPRNYELPVRAVLHWSGGEEAATGTLVLNKNGLLRFDSAAPAP